MKQMTVSITGAAGQIGYAMLFRLASGEIFGKDTLVHLRLLELSQALPALEGVKMELDDCAFPQLGSITTTDQLDHAFQGADWCLLVGSVPRKQGMERSDLLKINGGIFTDQGRSIDQNAKENCKILVVGNPCNTNALIAASQCKRIKKRNFFAMTMLDEQRAISQLAEKAGVHNTDVRGVTIWGNHSSTQYPDFYHATIKDRLVTDMISDDNWLQNDFITTVQQRGAAIIKARGASSAASAASAALRTVQRLHEPTPEGEHFSVAVLSSEANHHYRIEEEIMFSYPVRYDGDDWKVVEGINHNDFAKEKIQATYEELKQEKDLVKDLLGS